MCFFGSIGFPIREGFTMSNRHKHADLLIYASENADAVFYVDGVGTNPSVTGGIKEVLAFPDMAWHIKPKTVKKWQWAYPEVMLGNQCASVWKLTEKHYAAGECHLINAIPLMNTEIEE